MVKGIVEKAEAGEMLKANEIGFLFEIPLCTCESAYIQSVARRMSEKVSGSHAEVHAQVGLNITRCPRNCLFCSFAV
jgi:biotin synthase